VLVIRHLAGALQGAMQHKCRGSQSLRYRLVLSHLANRPLRCVPPARRCVRRGC
jgi:hypothetical protein